MRSSTFPHLRRMFVCLVAMCAAGTVGILSIAHAQVGKPEGLYYKSWAVVVGVENYLVAPKVPGALESAHAVAAALQGLGFDEVIELQDKEASSKHLLQILNDYLPRKVGRQDRVLFFFAGHAGVTQDSQSKELGYLVPWDAQLNNPAKAITFDQLKEFSRRSASKHILMLFDANIRGWEVTAPQPLSLEGRLSPEDDTEKRAVQVLTAAEKEEAVGRAPGQSAFVMALVSGLNGAADLNKNGWLMASELAAQVKQDVEAATGRPIGPGTLYATLSRLEERGLIEALAPVDRRRPYRLSGLGASVLEAELEGLSAFAALGLRRLQGESG